MTQPADTRVPLAWCNYPGDVTAAIERDIASGTPKGPNGLGESLWPVTAEYDPETGRTRVGFSYVAPPT